MRGIEPRLEVHARVARMSLSTAETDARAAANLVLARADPHAGVGAVSGLGLGVNERVRVGARKRGELLSDRGVDLLEMDPENWTVR